MQPQSLLRVPLSLLGLHWAPVSRPFWNNKNTKKSWFCSSLSNYLWVMCIVSISLLTLKYEASVSQTDRIQAGWKQSSNGHTRRSNYGKRSWNGMVRTDLNVDRVLLFNLECCSPTSAPLLDTFGRSGGHLIYQDIHGITRPHRSCSFQDKQSRDIRSSSANEDIYHRAAPRATLESVIMARSWHPLADSFKKKRPIAALLRFSGWWLSQKNMLLGTITQFLWINLVENRIE